MSVHHEGKRSCDRAEKQSLFDNPKVGKKQEAKRSDPCLRSRRGPRSSSAASAGGERNDSQTRRDYSRQTQLLAVRLSRNGPIHYMLAVGDE